MVVSTSGADTSFRVLGPLVVVHRGVSREVPTGRQQALLAALLLRPNETVPASTLIEQVWGGDADRTVLNVCVMRLRRSLHDPDRELIRAEGVGYRVVVDETSIDLHRFRRLCAEAGTARDRGDGQAERSVLREALELWRGDAFAGIVSPVLQAEAGLILEEERLAAVENRVAADLACGAHAEVIRELRQLVADHPFRERFWCQLLLALYRTGRQSDALDAYATARRRLTDELGIEPSDELRELHRRILASDPALRAQTSTPEPAPDVVPAQLPPAPAGFSGREDQLRRLNRLPHETEPVPATLITGTPGVGKTALAVHWASRNRKHWPDGQLYMDLRGYGPEAAVRPIEALAYFLRAIGVPAEQVPSLPAEAAALFRSLVADRRMLILLDNAATTDQVRPLLPGGTDCTVLVTSRDRLTGLLVREGARSLSLDVMADADARRLLAHAVGDIRLDAEPDAVGELARLCDYLPLALRITAADLVGHPDRGLGEHVRGLRDGDRLDALQVAEDPEMAVRAAFRASYARLPGPVRRMFRLLGLFPGTEINVDAAAALAGTDPADSRRLLDRLVCAHLVTPRGSDRFTLHDLLRLFAAEQSRHEDPEPERGTAMRRLYRYWTSNVEAAAMRLYPQLLRIPPPDGTITARFDDETRAMAWLETEWPNLVSAVRYAAAHGPRSDACLLATGVRGYLFSTKNTVDGMTIGRAALAAARATGDQRAEVLAYLILAEIHHFNHEHRTTIRHYERALALTRHLGWLKGQAGVHNNLAELLRLRGRLADASEHMSRAMELHRRTGHLAGQAVTLGNLGRTRMLMGEYSQAEHDLRRSLHLHERIGAPSGRGRILGSLGETLYELGQYQVARKMLVEAVSVQRTMDDRASLPYTLSFLAAVLLATGDHAQALAHATEAVTLAHGTPGGQDSEAQSLCILADIEQAAGEHDRAGTRFQRALDLTAADSGQRYTQVEAMIGLAGIHLARGRPKPARRLLDRAIAISRRCGYGMWELRAVALAGTITGETSTHD